MIGYLVCMGLFLQMHMIFLGWFGWASAVDVKGKNNDTYFLITLNFTFSTDE